MKSALEPRSPEPRPSGSGPPAEPEPPPRRWFEIGWPTVLGGWCGVTTWPAASLLWDVIRGKIPPPDLAVLPQAMGLAFCVGWLPGGFAAAFALRVRDRREADWPDGLTRFAGAFLGAAGAVWGLIAALVLLFLAL